MNEAWEQITAGGKHAVLDEVDVQVIASWMFNDFELRGGGTVAERYARREDLAAEERVLAGRIAAARLGLLRVMDVAPGAWIELDDVTGEEQMRVLSNGVSRQVRSGDLLVARPMPGPPAPSLWGPVGFVTGENGPELRALLTARIDLLGLGEGPRALAAAMHYAAREVTMMLAPGLRCAASSSQAA
jgi:hypothetical protein